MHAMTVNHHSTNPNSSPLTHSSTPTLTASAWRCRACGALLGLEQGGELHVKYRDLNHWITGRCRHVCRRCGAMNTIHTVPAVAVPTTVRATAVAEGEGR